LICEVREKVIDSRISPVLRFLFVLTLSFAPSACGKSSGGVSDSTSPAQPVSVSSAPSTPAPAPSAAAQSSPTPTPHPAIKQAQAQPGTPVSVPESMKRPLTAEEMKKALQALPPEVRARIMGMQKAPSPPPQPAKK
jgi:hypothetical protein